MHPFQVCTPERAEAWVALPDVTGQPTIVLCTMQPPVLLPTLSASASGFLGVPDSNSFFLCCLYKGEDRDPEHPLEGFLKGPLLVRVSFQVYKNIKQLLMPLRQAYQHIFTSPSSATRGEASEVTSRWRDIANVLCMNNHVTPRLIAYAATQVC